MRKLLAAALIAVTSIAVAPSVASADGYTNCSVGYIYTNGVRNRAWGKCTSWIGTPSGYRTRGTCSSGTGAYGPWMGAPNLSIAECFNGQTISNVYIQTR